MSIFDEPMRKKISNYIKANMDRIAINTALFEILENSLDDLLIQKMRADIGDESLKNAIERRAPINYYRKVIDKMTNIYQHGVERKVIGGNDQDQMLVDWYVEQLRLNSKMNANNESFNAYQYSLLDITLKDPDPITMQRKPFVRTIPNHQFLIMNESKVDPTQADIIIIFKDPIIDEQGNKKPIFYVYTNEEFMIIDLKGDVQTEIMFDLEQDGINYYMSYPFVYANNSENLVMPLPQKDDLQMALLIPLNLTDLNYAHKFQAFSLFVGIDVDDQNIKIAPNAWLSLKSEAEGLKPSVETIKPTIDTMSSLSLNSSEISLWLSSKGIRPGAIGNIDGDQFASGISKMIDESDTYESRIKQIEEYQAIEADFWEKLLTKFHPVWVAQGLIENRTIFSPGARVVTTFIKPKPFQTRMDLINQLDREIVLGFKSRKDAFRELYPELDDEEIEKKMLEIDQERIMEVLMTGDDDNGTQQNGNQDNNSSSDRSNFEPAS